MFNKYVIDLIGKAVALAGLLFTALTYSYNLYIEREQKRYEQAMTLIEQYTDSGVRDNENKLSGRLLYYTQAGMDLNDRASYRDDHFELVARETLFGYGGEDGGAATEIKPFLHEFLEIVDFYDRVTFCLEAKICDSALVNQYFCPRARSFTTRHHRLIAYYQEYSGSKEWSNGLTTLNRLCLKHVP